MIAELEVMSEERFRFLQHPDLSGLVSKSMAFLFEQAHLESNAVVS